MDQDTRLYHNPRCSKSRAALALLRDRGIEPTVVLYLDDAPTRGELARLVEAGLQTRSMLRAGEPEYAALALGDAALSDEALLEAMHRYPQLIERPIFLHRGRAIIGRPPERVLELLD